MVTKRRAKNSRQRAKTTHGWGAKKKHRGSGNKGGVGMASTGKRSDAKKPSIWKIKDYFGMHGFIYKGQKINYVCLNICDLPKYASKSGKSELNLADFGFNKLLGDGKPDRAYNITVEYASPNAVAKIEAAKGKVNVLSKKEEAASAGSSK